jgi:hypothetical protein
MILTDETLWVVDHDEPRVGALEPRSGKLRRVVGATGSGPGEWRGPLSLAGVDSGRLYVFDGTQRNLSRLSRLGALEVQTTLEGLPLPTQVCLLGGPHLLSSQSIVKRAIHILTFDAKRSVIVHDQLLPFPELASAGIVGSQVQLRPTDRGCALAPLYGNAVVRVASDGSLNAPIQMIESVPIPLEVSRPVGGGRTSRTVAKGTVRGVLAVAELTSHLVVAFAGASAQRGRILDFYDVATGRYSGSLLFSETVRSLASRNNTLIIQSEDETGVVNFFAFRLGDSTKVERTQ